MNRCHYIDGKHTLSKHAFIEIVNNTKVHNYIGGFKTCFKVYFDEGVVYWGTKVWNIDINFFVIKKQMKE